MGPKIYDELEALKAQAIAARTYAVRNLGQFRREGYDICPGPACQAYLGFCGEEPLSDQAVKETAGLVATYDGKPIDALYTATCGGETRDVGDDVPRPQRAVPQARALRGDGDDVDRRPRRQRAADGAAGQRARSSPRSPGCPDAATAWSAREVEQAVNAAMQNAFAGRADAATVIAPRRRAALSRRDARLDPTGASHAARGSQVLFSADRRPGAMPYLAAAFLIKFGFLPSQDIDRVDLAAAMPREELYGLLGSWLRKHGACQRSHRENPRGRPGATSR